MKKNFKVYGIIAIAVFILAATSSGLPGVDAFIEKAIEIAAYLGLVLTIILFIWGPITVSMHYFEFTSIEEFSSVWDPAVVGSNANPAIVAVVNSFIRLLQPFYVIAIILTGVYLLFVAGTPAGRAKAKSMFWKLILSMVMVTLSMQLFQIILNLSAGLTLAVASIGGVNALTIQGIVLPFTILLITFAAMSALLGLGLPVTTFLIIALIFTILIPFVVNLRYIILLILAMLFPFTIFLHFLDFPYTKAFGAKLIRMTFVWTFLPVVMMLAVVGSSIAVNSYSEQCGELSKLNYIPGVNVLASLAATIFGNTNCLMMIIMSLVGTIIIIATPFMMSGVMTWIGAGLAMAGMAYFDRPWGAGLTTFGGVLAGMGPGALMMGGTQMMFRGLMPQQTIRGPQQPAEGAIREAQAHASGRGSIRLPEE